MKICQFWGTEFVSLNQKYEEREAELYCYIYIVIFGKDLLELYWIVLMCF